jgi:hypothetical protein
MMNHIYTSSSPVQNIKSFAKRDIRILEKAGILTRENWMFVEALYMDFGGEHVLFSGY